MPVPLDFLHTVGTNALPILAGSGLAVAEVGSSILVKVWEWWGAKAKEAERRKELETLATATAQELRRAVKELAAELAHDHPPQVRSKLEGYLMAVPAQIRRTLRRPSDTTGQTVPPDLNLTRPEHLAPLLPPRPPRFAEGDKAPGTDFELVELLGIGGFGEVWKARNAFMPGAPAVALKFCLDPDAAANLRRETALLDRIQREGKHPGIVELRNTFLSAEPPFLEYELIEGGDLGGLIGEWHRQKGGPSPNQAARVIRRLAETMAFAHEKRIVHRDLKPANILLANAECGMRNAELKTEDRTGDVSSQSELRIPHSAFRLKIADFGIGGIAAEAAARQALLTRGGATLTAAAAHGSYSLYYASPEQMRGAAPDPRDDVHALGVIWYQLLVGDLTVEAPRGAGWKRRLAAKGMAEPLIELLESCVATDREDRPADAREIADCLDAVLAETNPGIDLDLSETPYQERHVTPQAEPRPVSEHAPLWFRYEATDITGSEVRGKIEAANEAEAIRMLQERDRFVTKLTPVSERMPTTQLPTPADKYMSRISVEDHLKKTRWEDFVARLRQLLSYHDRLRWSTGGWASVVQTVLVLAISAAIGFAANVVMEDEVVAVNRPRGQSIAAKASKPDMPIVWYSLASGGGYFSLQDKPSSTSSSMGPRYYVRNTGTYPYPGRGRAAYAPASAESYITPPDTIKPQVDQYIYSANQALAEATEEFNRSRTGMNLFEYSIAVGVTAFAVLGGLFIFLRRSARRTLETWTREQADTIATEFAPEMRALPEPLDLNQPSVVARMISALEVCGQIWRPLPSPLWLWHRFLAPF